MNAKQRGQQARPIVIVTGANAGVGYAICHRLLVQLAQRIPPDAIPQRPVSRSIPLNSAAEVDLSEFTDCEGLTLILACRSVSKADVARTELLKYLDEEVEKIKRKGGEDARHAETFKENVNLVVHRVDLASVASVFNFARDIESKYPYVSHLVCNAGVANFTGYNWPVAFKQLLTDFVAAVTSPLYKLQQTGEMSEDGLGWIWQCNVFGHYVLFRLLDPLLSRYKSLTSSPARVLWMSSMEALPEAYDPSDWQLVRNPRPYEASKYQIDLLAGWFEQQQQRRMHESIKQAKDGEVRVPIRHFLFHPGVVRTNIATKSLNSTVLDLCMQLSFLIAHFLGSRAHVITPYKAAISAVHLMLIALPFITVATPSTSNSQNSHYSSNPKTTSNTNSSPTSNPKKLAPPTQTSPTPLKFGSEVDYWFNECVGTSKVQEWEERQEQAEELVRHCDELFQAFGKKEEAR